MSRTKESSRAETGGEKKRHPTYLHSLTWVLIVLVSSILPICWFRRKSNWEQPQVLVFMLSALAQTRSRHYQSPLMPLSHSPSPYMPHHPTAHLQCLRASSQNAPAPGQRCQALETFLVLPQYTTSLRMIAVIFFTNILHVYLYFK